MWYTFRGDLLARGFGQKILVFLNKNAAVKDYELRGMKTWVAEMAIGGAKVPLYTVEDNDGVWPEPLCKHCSITEWENVLDSKKRFHMVVPLEDAWNLPLSESILDRPEGHSLLYAIIHTNACAHLLWVQRSASSVMSGSDMMDIWDCICKYLEIRNVTVEDVSKKGDVDLRLFCGVVHGRSWFGRWGYNFWRGSYGVDEVQYEVALAYLRNLDIDQVVEVFCKVEGESSLVHRLKGVLLYRNLSGLDSIKTLIDMLVFLLTYPAKSRMTTEALPVENIPCKSWTRKQINGAVVVLVKILKNRGSNAITREDLSDAANSEVSPSGLVDNVISSMRRNLKVGKHQIVVCRENPISKLLEYWLERVPLPATNLIDVWSDAVFLYETIVLRYPKLGSEYSMVKLSVDSLLSCKYLLKGAEPCTKDSGKNMKCKCGTYEDEGGRLLQCNMCEVKLSVDSVLNCKCLLEGEESCSKDAGKKVKCKCGTYKDDGERLVQCNMCEVYEHLKCSGVDKIDTEVYVHICDGCLTEQKEKQLVAEAKEKSKAELEIVGEDEVRQI